MTALVALLWALGASSDAGASSFTLPNRMKITPRPLADTEIVVVQGRIDAGPVHEPAGRHGVSALATELLASPYFGEDPRAPTLAWTLWEDPTSFANFRWIEFRSACFPEELPSLLQVLEGRLGRAAAPWDLSEEEVGRLRQRSAARVRELAVLSGPALWASGLARLYPARSPLAVPAWADPPSLERVRREDLLAFLAANVIPARTHLVFTGALPTEALGGQLRDTLRGVGDGRRARPLSPLPTPRGPDRWQVHYLHRPGNARDRILVLVPGDRSRPGDRAATEALVRILGHTGTGGWLGRSVVDTGLADWARASLEEKGAPGFLAIRVAAAPEHTPEVLERIRSVLEEATAGRFTGEEFQEALRARRAEADQAERDPSAAAAALLWAPADPSVASPPTLAQLRRVGKRLLANGAPLALVAGDHPPPESVRPRTAHNKRNGGKSE